MRAMYPISTAAIQMHELVTTDLDLSSDAATWRELLDELRALKYEEGLEPEICYYRLIDPGGLHTLGGVAAGGRVQVKVASVVDARPIRVSGLEFLPTKSGTCMDACMRPVVAQIVSMKILPTPRATSVNAEWIFDKIGQVVAQIDVYRVAIADLGGAIYDIPEPAANWVSVAVEDGPPLRFDASTR